MEVGLGLLQPSDEVYGGPEGGVAVEEVGPGHVDGVAGLREGAAHAQVEDAAGLAGRHRAVAGVTRLVLQWSKVCIKRGQRLGLYGNE